MLVRLHPEQFQQAWDTFAPLVQDALPPEISIREKPLVHILRAVLMERATPWIEVNEQTGNSRAFILTTVEQEPIMFSKHLLIYILTVFGDPGNIDEWQSALTTLRKHADSKKCKTMKAYVHDEEYGRYLSMLGADVGTVVAQFEV